MTEVLLLGRRAVREVIRYPEATIPTLFIPLFFLAVNIGQVSKTFPSTTPFLHGQGYVAFQMPVSLMFAVATATTGLALVTEIDGGYFDKLLVAPIRRDVADRRPARRRPGSRDRGLDGRPARGARLRRTYRVGTAWRDRHRPARVALRGRVRRASGSWWR